MSPAEHYPLERKRVSVRPEYRPRRQATAGRVGEGKFQAMRTIDYRWCGRVPSAHVIDQAQPNSRAIATASSLRVTPSLR